MGGLWDFLAVVRDLRTRKNQSPGRGGSGGAAGPTSGTGRDSAGGARPRPGGVRSWRAALRPSCRGRGRPRPPLPAGWTPPGAAVAAAPMGRAAEPAGIWSRVIFVVRLSVLPSPPASPRLPGFFGRAAATAPAGTPHRPREPPGPRGRLSRRLPPPLPCPPCLS